MSFRSHAPWVALLGCVQACVQACSNAGGTAPGADQAPAPQAGSTAPPSSTPPNGGHASEPDTAPAAASDAGSARSDAGAPPGTTPLADVDAGDALGAPDVAGTPSNGGTLTFQGIGAVGSYPSRRDPETDECSAYRNGDCCMTRREVQSDALTPWDQELIMTLRGPVIAHQVAVYQPAAADGESTVSEWQRVAAWDARVPSEFSGLAFEGDATRAAPFAGSVGDQCLVDVTSDREFACGPGSSPYCPEASAGQPRGYGFAGSKLFVMLLAMPHDGAGAITPAQDCSDDTSGNWHDAPWIGFSLGELVRSGKFGDCHCYAQDPAEWWLGDGCGQLNAFEVVNDNNEFRNLDVFSTNFFGYQGYIGEGPCGAQCDLGALGPEVDLIDKRTSAEAAAGAIATPSAGPGAAFLRPSVEPRYFVVLFDVDARTVQLALIAPAAIPTELAPLLPALPTRLARGAIDALLQLRLPR
jgi:hypothetical protein